MRKTILKIAVWIVGVSAGCLLFIIIVVGGLFYATIPWHDLNLWRMERALANSAVHPADSHVEERHAFLGSRYADSEDCTYAIGEIRSTLLSREDVERAYVGAAASIRGFARHMPIRIVIIKKDTSLPLGEPAEVWTYAFKTHKGVTTQDKTYYLAYLYEPERSWLGDFRCYESEMET